MSNKLEYVSLEGLRIDGRRVQETRKLDFRLNLFSRADGSCYLEQGNTKVLCAVYGPHEIRYGSSAYASTDELSFSQKSNQQQNAILNCEFSMATFSTGGERRQRSKGDRKSTEIAMLIKQTFESVILTHLFPRTQINIFVQVLQADGGVASACLNATSLALLDAGIPMKDFLVSCTSSVVDGHILCDLNYLEESANGPLVPISYLPHQNSISLLQVSDSKLKIETFEQVVNMAIQGCKSIHQVLDAKIKQMTKEGAERRGLFEI